MIRLRARIIQSVKHQLQRITKSGVNGKRKQRPAGIRVTCCIATVFSRLNTVAVICVSKMEFSKKYLCLCVCLVGGLLLHVDWSHLV
jgi:hypothetical protein